MEFTLQPVHGDMFSSPIYTKISNEACVDGHKMQVS